jgi:Tfp pilus assembly protein PilN
MSILTRNPGRGANPESDEAPPVANWPARELWTRRTAKAASPESAPGTPARSDDSSRIGGAPRVDLLPQSIRDAHRQSKSRRKLLLALGGVTVVVALGAVGALQLSSAAQAQLESEQAETLSLLTQRGEFTDLIAVQDRLVLGRAAQTVGASPEIDWSGYLRDLRKTLPGGVELTAVTIDSASPVQAYEQSTGPLQGPRVATLSFTATSDKLPDVPVWLDRLGTLPAFVDAVPNSVTLDDGGSYLVNITMHIGADAFSGRFAPEGTE